jgi:hypothetical protein
MSEEQEHCPACNAPVRVVGKPTSLHYEALGTADVLTEGDDACRLCGAQPHGETRYVPEHPIWGAPDQPAIVRRAQGGYPLTARLIDLLESMEIGYEIRKGGPESYSVLLEGSWHPTEGRDLNSAIWLALPDDLRLKADSE